MFENPRRGRQARNFTANAPKILDLKLSSEQIFSENWRWVPCLVKGVDQNTFDAILWLSPPRRLPLGIPTKIAIIEKIESARGTMGRGKRPSSFPSCLALSLFLSPSLPTTQRGLCGGERRLTKNFAKGSVCVCVLWEGGEIRGLVTYFGQELEFFPRPTTLIQLDPLQQFLL